ncbi:MAG: hypothetical protein KF800_18885 [Lysobacter sp.]|nr:hypothetical protein [Lysobacter sp.]
MRTSTITASASRRWWTPLTAFMLTFGLAACDLPGVQSAKVTDQGLEARITSFDTASPALSGAALAGRPGTFADVPDETPAPRLPPVEDMLLTPLESLGDPEGNALLTVRFIDDAQLPDTLSLVVDKDIFTFKRDASDKSVFNGMVRFDFDGFVREQKARQGLIAETRATGEAAFAGREFLGEEKFAFIDPQVIERARLTSTPFRIPRVALAMPASAVDPRRELMITDVSVVNDPTRTFDICNNTGNPNGAWTFKTLMTNMANQPFTGIDPAVFTENWLQSWNANHTINTFPVPARPNIGPLVLNTWPRIGGKLDLNRSPFRLLAIVNRVDLRGNTVYGGGSAGEGRFVFGVVNRNASGGCSTTPFLVIFEYGVPISGCTNVKNYGQQWVNLGNIALGSAAFNPALQAITDQFTTANAAPNKPNRSALNQIRTNENALNPLWELREFVLPGRTPVATMLNIVSTKNTPHHTRNNTGQLASYMNSGLTSVPASYLGSPFLTGSNFNFSIADGAVWNAAGATNADRHRVSLETCSACHGGESRANGNPFVAFPPANGPETNFVHIDVRLPGAQSRLSKFLIGTGNLALPTTFPKNDPINGVPQRSFGDLLRRQQDLANLMNSTCQTTGLLQAIQFQPLDMVH